MNYVEVDVRLAPPQPYAEVVVALLADIGYESFDEYKTGVKAYIAQDDFDAQAVQEVLESLSEVEMSYTTQVLEHTNWNAKWESEYQPVIIDERCVIRALFHESMPQYEYEIIVQPQMSFGTGHHPTTLLMMRTLLDMDVKGKSMLDLGSGTGVLAILAEKKGAVDIVATDIEDHIVENARDNARHNACVHIRVDKADMSLPSTGSYPLILANINLNTLIKGLGSLVGQAVDGASVVMSGFYDEDAPTLIAAAERYGLRVEDKKTHDRWAAIHFIYTASV